MSVFNIYCAGCFFRKVQTPCDGRISDTGLCTKCEEIKNPPFWTAERVWNELPKINLKHDVFGHPYRYDKERELPPIERRIYFGNHGDGFKCHDVAEALNYQRPLRGPCPKGHPLENHWIATDDFWGGKYPFPPPILGRPIDWRMVDAIVQHDVRTIETASYTLRGHRL